MGGQNAYSGAHEYCLTLFDYETMGLRRIKRSRCAVYPTCHRIRLTQRTRAYSLRWTYRLAHRCWMAPVARERPARLRVQPIKCWRRHRKHPPERRIFRLRPPPSKPTALSKFPTHGYGRRMTKRLSCGSSRQPSINISGRKRPNILSPFNALLRSHRQRLRRRHRRRIDFGDRLSEMLLHKRDDFGRECVH